MFNQTTKAHDAFAFSLGGMTTVASFFAAPAIAADRINTVRDEQVRQARISRDVESRDWLDSHRQPAHECA